MMLDHLLMFESRNETYSYFQVTCILLFKTKGPHFLLAVELLASGHLRIPEFLCILIFSLTNTHIQKRLFLCITMIIKLILKHQDKKEKPHVFVWNEVSLSLKKSIIQRSIKTWLRNEQFKRREGMKEAFIRHGGKSQRGLRGEMST